MIFRRSNKERAMMNSKLTLALLAAAGLTMATGAFAEGMSKDSRDLAVKNAATQFASDKATCSSMSGNAKDVCMQAAKGKEQVAKADAEAAYRNTPAARESARVARANANHGVAKEKCDDLTGNVKDVCVKEAKAALVSAKADAKVDRVAADSKVQAVEKVTEARKDASDDKRDAAYKVALEKCDSLSGAGKDSCVTDAKARYGKS
jgi:hypothetical protein